MAGQERPPHLANVLPRGERLKLRAGVLRRVEPGDTIPELARRMGQSEFYIRQSVRHDLKAIGELLTEGNKVFEILACRPEWTPSFVDLARRLHYGTERNKKAGRQPRDRSNGRWKDFNRGATVEARRRRRETERRRRQIEEVNTADEAAVIADLANHLSNE